MLLTPDFDLLYKQVRKTRCILEIKITEDQMEAILVLSPGEEPDEKKIRDQLVKMKISAGICEDILKTVVGTEKGASYIIARGKPPEKGFPSKFESLLEDASIRWPKRIKDKPIDWHRIEKIASVMPGDPLMKKLVPTKGADGYTVTGNVLPGIWGDDIPFAPRLTGVEISPDDPNLLIALTGGKPVIVNHGVNIEDVYTCNAVDFHTGSISFSGSVKVNGNVNPGMYIKAEGDVYISGTVESATVESDGDVIIKGGIIGVKEHHADEPESNDWMSHVKAKGMVMCLYAEHSIIEAYKTINIMNFCLSSSLRAVEKITVGKKGAKMGVIIGGETISSQGVVCNVTGTDAGITTKISLMFSDIYTERKNYVLNQLKETEGKLERLEKMMEMMKNSPVFRHKTGDNADKKLENLVSEKELLTTQLASIEALESSLYKSKITIYREINPGLHANIGDFAVNIENKTPGKTIGIKVDEEGNTSLDLSAPV